MVWHHSIGDAAAKQAAMACCLPVRHWLSVQAAQGVAQFPVCIYHRCYHLSKDQVSFDRPEGCSVHSIALWAAVLLLFSTHLSFAATPMWGGSSLSCFVWACFSQDCWVYASKSDAMASAMNAALSRLCSGCASHGDNIAAM